MLKRIQSVLSGGMLIITLINPVLGQQLKTANQIQQVGNNKASALARAISQDELLDKVGIAFKGKIQSISKDVTGPVPIRIITFEILDPIIGIEKDIKSYTIKQWLNIDTMLEKVPEGEAHLFFFHKPSAKLGLTSLVGGEQGIVDLNEISNVIKFHTLNKTSHPIKDYEEMKKFIKSHH